MICLSSLRKRVFVVFLKETADVLKVANLRLNLNRTLRGSPMYIGGIDSSSQVDASRCGGRAGANNWNESVRKNPVNNLSYRLQRQN